MYTAVHACGAELLAQGRSYSTYETNDGATAHMLYARGLTLPEAEVKRIHHQQVLRRQRPAINEVDIWQAQGQWAQCWAQCVNSMSN